MDSIALIVAAVVALVVVVVGFSMLFHPAVDPIFNPSIEVENLLKSQVNRPGEVRTSVDLQFQNLNTLNPKAIAEASGVVLSEQICISLGEHDSTPGFALNSSSSNSILSYSNSSRIVIKLSILCDTGSTLRADLSKNGLPPKWMDASPQCQAIAQSDLMGCIAALRYA